LEERLNVCEGSFREGRYVSRKRFRRGAHSDAEEKFERGLTLLRAQVTPVPVCEIALRQMLPPYDFLFGMEISPEVVQPVCEGGRIHFLKRKVDVLDSGHESRRKFSVAHRTLFKLVETNVLSAHDRLMI
jgi:hypothetical protein